MLYSLAAFSPSGPTQLISDSASEIFFLKLDLTCNNNDCLYVSGYSVLWCCIFVSALECNGNKQKQRK